MTKKVWAIIGGGNGGQSLAGHFGLLGYSVRLYDIMQETVDTITAQGGVHVDGVVQGFGKVELASTDIGKVIDGADLLMVVAPALAHADIARTCAPHLKDGQVVIIHPGATCGVLHFKKVLDDCGCKAKLVFGETNSLIYACRAVRPGHVNIYGIKQELTIGAFPANEIEKVLRPVQEIFPQMIAGKNVMETSLGNNNAVMHPAPTLLSTALVESDRDWRYYMDGVTPSIGNFVTDLDKERLEIGKAFGITLRPILEWYRVAYGVQADTLSEATRNTEAYKEIKGQKTLRTRYLLEDLPMSLVPMIYLGKLMGVDVSHMETIVRLGEQLLGEEFLQSGRSLKNLGLDGMTPADLERYLETGERRCVA